MFSSHRWLCWSPRDSANTGGYGRWRRWLRTARCDCGVARPLHAEDHSPPPTEAANAGPTESGRVPRAPGASPTWPLWSFLAARSTTDRSADPLGREREAERRGRGPGLGVTPSRSTQRLGADRSAPVYPLCARAIRRSTPTTCTHHPGIRRVCRCIAPSGFEPPPPP
jgi:hypothetical protein